MHRRTRTTLLATIAAAGALVAPGAAQAAFTGNGFQLTGDDANDTLVLGVENGLWTHNQTGGGFASKLDFNTAAAGDQTRATTESPVVLGGGGDDSLSGPTVASAGVIFDGGDGDDVLTGATNSDTINGGNGNDRIVGARGNDTMNGGAGNDVLVWNNGDGTDVMNGDAGADEIEVNGAPTAGDAFTIQAGIGGRVRFDRTNLGLFNLDIGTAERMTVNGLGGNDTVAANANLGTSILLTVSGGTGDDTVTGSPNADLIAGGDGADTLSGAGGDDRIVGDRGNDTMNGGDGDDTTVWNNGDGTDVMNGDAGTDRVEVNGAPGAGDVFTVAPNAGRVKFDRTNLGLFSLDIGAAEALLVNGLGGDDAVTAQAGAGGLIAMTADGGSGNDTLNGGEGDETLLGGSGNDTLNPGGGFDIADGGDGDDALIARDGIADLLRCGAGTDSAQADGAGIDAATGCETVDRPAANGQPGGQAGAGGGTVADRLAKPVRLGAFSARKRAGRHVLRFAVSCPAGEPGGCKGEVRLTTASAVRIGGVRVRVHLGTARFTLRAGQRRTVQVTLPRGAQRFAGSGRRLRVSATAISRDGVGNAAETAVRRTARLAK